MPEYRMGAEDILMLCNLESRSGKECIEFLKLFMLVAIRDSLVCQGSSVEVCSEEHFSQLVIIRW